MAAPTFGSLFSGYGGLEVGAQSVLGGELLWYSEYEPPSEKNPRPTQAAARIMAHHHPGVPNLGDMTKVDWHTVPRVDVLTGGSPCQDVSLAGKRAGMRAGTRSGLWARRTRPAHCGLAAPDAEGDGRHEGRARAARIIR